MQNNRRKFLKSFTAGAAGLAVLPVFGASLETPLEDINTNFLETKNMKTCGKKAFQK